MKISENLFLGEVQTYQKMIYEKSDEYFSAIFVISQIFLTFLVNFSDIFKQFSGISKSFKFLATLKIKYSL